MNEFAGRVAVITGAGRGIGRGIALRCAREGMKIVLAGIGQESLTRTDADLQALGAETLVVPTDVSRRESVAQLADKSYEAFGAVDLLVNNAGVNVPVTVLKSSIDDWNWIMGVNFYGVLYGVHTFIPRMLQQETPSHLVNVSSVAGLIPGGARTGAPYSVSKHAVVVLTEALYFELAGRTPRIGVSVYCPGFVDTEIDTSDRSRPDRFKKEATSRTEEQKAADRARLASGYSVEKATQILFDGIRNERLYIGAPEYHEQLPQIAHFVQYRADNILQGRNPKVRERS